LIWKTCSNSYRNKSLLGRLLGAVPQTALQFRKKPAFNRKTKVKGMVKIRTSAEKGIDTQVMMKMAVLTSLKQATMVVETIITINNRESSSICLK
jgi:hypothetical protein